MGSRKDDKPHLLAEKIQWRSSQRGSGQSLLHRGKAAVANASRKKNFFFLRVDSKMFEYQPRYDLDIAAEGVEPNCLPLKVLNGFELRAGDEGEGSTWHVTSNDLNRDSLDR